MVKPTEHAVERYIERFEGNLSMEVAEARVLKIFRAARFRRVLPGDARLYASGPVNFVIQDGYILTVYRLTYDFAPMPMAA